MYLECTKHVLALYYTCTQLVSYMFFTSIGCVPGLFFAFKIHQYKKYITLAQYCIIKCVSWYRRLNVRVDDLMEMVVQQMYASSLFPEITIRILGSLPVPMPIFIFAHQ